MRWAGAITILLILLIISSGCGQRIPTRNTTSWGNTTPKKTGGSASHTTAVPTTTSPIVEVTLMPVGTETPSPIPTYRNPPQMINITANLTVIDEKTLAFSYNRSAYTYTVENPPLLIDYTLTVPNISKTRVENDPVTGGDRTVTVTYPDPVAFFEVTVKDLETNRIIVRDGYGGVYDVSKSKDVWVRYPGSYYIEFFGNRVTAKIKFLIPKEN